MALYIAESYEWQVLHDGRMSDGAVGVGHGSEKIYLHVIEISAADLARLGPREDEHGNKQHDRLALPMNDEWWLAVDGDKAWPKTTRPKVVSHCKLDGGMPKAVPLSEEEAAVLVELGVTLPK